MSYIKKLNPTTIRGVCNERTKKTIGATLPGLVALGALTAGAANAGVPDQPTHWEKCAGSLKLAKTIVALLTALTVVQVKPKKTT